METNSNETANNPINKIIRCRPDVFFSDVAIEFSENSITLRKTIEIPFDFLDMYKRGMSGYEIENKTLSWREEDWGGDNG
jgi:hypothetical protein